MSKRKIPLCQTSVGEIYAKEKTPVEAERYFELWVQTRNDNMLLRVADLSPDDMLDLGIALLNLARKSK